MKEQKRENNVLQHLFQEVKQIPSQFSNSAKELMKINTLMVSALMLALGTILGFVFTVETGIPGAGNFGISVIAPQLVSALYGPAVGGIIGGLGDLIDCLLNGYAFFPGFFLNAILGQMIYGIVLYKKQLTLLRIIVSKILVAVLINLPLGTLWQSILYKKGFWPIFIASLIKQPVQIVVLGVLFYMFVSALKNAKVFEKMLNK